MVVGKDRAPHVLLIARRLQIAPGGEDRVDWVVGVLLAVLVRIHPIRPPTGGDELHPPQRTRRRHVQVAAVVGLDLVDRRQDLPPHPVLDPRRLIDRQQKHRHPELPNHEIRHTRRERRARQRIDEAGVRARGRPVGVAQARPARALLLLARGTIKLGLSLVGVLLELLPPWLLLSGARLLRPGAGLRRGVGRLGLGLGLRLRGGAGRHGHAGQLDLVDGGAVGHIDGDRHDLAGHQLDVDRPLLGGCGQGERRECGHGHHRSAEQELDSPRSHPSILVSSLRPPDEAPLGREQAIRSRCQSVSAPRGIPVS